MAATAPSAFARAIRAAIALVALASPGFAADGPPRALLLAPDLGAATTGGRFPDIDDEEIVAFDLDDGSLVPFIQDSNWPSLLGDANGNGRFDDVPAQVDALTAAAGGAVASAYDLLYSFTTDRQFLGGVVARDGDLVRLLPGGAAEIVVSEGALRLALSTAADIDLDGAAFEEDGTLLFSLDSGIVTSSQAIAAENGGSSLLSDETVFSFHPGGGRAHVRLRDVDVVAAVNRAFGTSYASVIEVQGLEALDGEILFTTGIFTGPGAGAVVSTAGGGSIACVGGIALDGSAFGLESPVDWNGLAVVREPIHPLVLDTALPVASRSMDGRIEIRIGAGTPLGLARILATPVARPVTTPAKESAFRGTGYIFVSRTEPMYARSVSSPRTLVRLDASGDAMVAFRLRPTTPTIALTLQAVDETTRTASHGIIVEIVP